MKVWVCVSIVGSQWMPVVFRLATAGGGMIILNKADGRRRDIFFDLGFMYHDIYGRTPSDEPKIPP